jgi:hypothetical protein
LGLPIIGGLSVGFDFYYDIDEIESYYTDISVSYALGLIDKLDLEASAKVAYAGEDFAEAYGGTEAGFYDFVISLGVSYALTDALSVGANINYVETMDEDVLPDELVDTNVFGGLSISYAF